MPALVIILGGADQDSTSFKYQTPVCVRDPKQEQTCNERDRSLAPRRTSVAVAVAKAHVQHGNLMHLVRGQAADAPLLAVPLSLHIRLHSARTRAQRWETRLFVGRPPLVSMMQDILLLPCPLQAQPHADKVKAI